MRLILCLKDRSIWYDQLGDYFIKAYCALPAHYRAGFGQISWLDDIHYQCSFRCGLQRKYKLMLSPTFQIRADATPARKFSSHCPNVFRNSFRLARSVFSPSLLDRRDRGRISANRCYKLVTRRYRPASSSWQLGAFQYLLFQTWIHDCVIPPTSPNVSQETYARY